MFLECRASPPVYLYVVGQAVVDFFFYAGKVVSSCLSSPRW